MEDAMNCSATMIAVGLLTLAGRTVAQSAEAPLTSIQKLAVPSQCASHVWKDRGRAPPTYIQGVALVFARAVCHPERSDVRVVSTAVNPAANSNDALVVYADQFLAVHMSNEASGVDTLRHTYTLLIGLGMMESSGQYCEGRDVSECFTTADSAEAGLLQTSFGAHTHSSSLDDLFHTYSADQTPCLLDAFKDSITCPIRHSHNPHCPSATSDVAGTGPGADWQRLTKACPAFATEYGAVVMRRNGGAHGEFNPIRKRQAELRPECDGMLQSVQNFVQQHPETCSSL
jgi:hypothetical protein